MHEASIVRALLELAADNAGPASRVLKVVVRVGRLTGVSPASLRLYFDVMRDDTLGPQAQLEVRLEPLRGRCTACAAQVLLREPAWSCEACGQPTLTFENGDELNLAELVVEDAEPHHDRAEDPQEEHGHRA